MVKSPKPDSQFASWNPSIGSMSMSDREQILATVRPVGRDVIEEKSAGEPLSDQPPEDIGKGDDHRVDLAALDLLAQLVEG
jgi:hypothetical protein